MPMNKDGQNRMDGFLHAATGTDSAHPDVQMYREHYRGTFSGPGLAGSSFDGAGLFVLLGFAGAAWLVFAAIHVATEYWPIALTVGIAIVLLAASLIINFKLPGYRKATLMLVATLTLSAALWISIATYYNLHFSKFPAPSAEAYLRMTFPVNGTSFPTALGIYLTAIYLVSLLPWTRRKMTPGKAIVLSNAILVAPVAAAFLVALMVVGVQRLL
ncbi:hypothetical protein [Hyphomicrobium sp.]|uniref:hypothetical protein n=1 Tax=Hyphomicrobium sp. TaxID=82 RepID=UPI0025C210C8|nr:hypothetical protein [Hyphomicrobium sp.]MCC7250460.1 hypothetical protein [Hyphomicrobium sp.]